MRNLVKNMMNFDTFIRSKYEEGVLWNYGKPTHPLYADLWDAWQARVPEGYVVVPVKCTNNMAHAAKEVDGRLSAFKYGDVWNAMLEAVEK